MPRDVSGNYTLPAGINPVVSNTVIDVDWANPTLSDIATQLNNVLTRDGLLGPVAPFSIVDGTAAIPGLAFSSETNSGLFRASAGNIGVSVQGIEQLRLTASAVTVKGTNQGQLVVSTTGTFAGGQGASINFADTGGTGGTIGFNGSVNQFDVRNSRAGPLTFSTSGSERARFDASGNLLIGFTSVPQASVDIRRASTGNALRIQGQSPGGEESNLEFGVDGTNDPNVFYSDFNWDTGGARYENRISTALVSAAIDNGGAARWLEIKASAPLAMTGGNPSSLRCVAFRYVSDTQVAVQMLGDDGNTRAVILTLS